MRELVSSREQLALAITRLQSLPALCEHEFIKGRMERASELTLLDIKHEIAEVQARAALAAARLQLAAYDPQPQQAPAPAPPSAPSDGVTVREAVAAVDAIAEHMPEISPETRAHLALLLSGYLEQKRK